MSSAERLTRPRLALVIGSGSIRCAAVLGLTKVLERAGIRLDRVIGCSAGSLYAGCIALGFDLDQMLAVSESDTASI